MEDKNKKPSMTELLAADLDDQPVMSRRARRRRADEENAAQVDLTQPAEETEFPVDEPTVEFKPIRNRAEETAAPKPVSRKKRPPRVVELPEEEMCIRDRVGATVGATVGAGGVSAKSGWVPMSTAAKITSKARAMPPAV